MACCYCQDCFRRYDFKNLSRPVQKHEANLSAHDTQQWMPEDPGWDTELAGHEKLCLCKAQSEGPVFCRINLHKLHDSISTM